MNLDETAKMGASMFRESNLSGDTGSGLDLDTLTPVLSSLAGGLSVALPHMVDRSSSGDSLLDSV